GQAAVQEREGLTPNPEEPADLADRPRLWRQARRRVLILSGRQETNAQGDRPTDRHEGGEDEQDARHPVDLTRRAQLRRGRHLSQIVLGPRHPGGGRLVPRRAGGGGRGGGGGLSRRRGRTGRRRTPRTRSTPLSAVARASASGPDRTTNERRFLAQDRVRRMEEVSVSEKHIADYRTIIGDAAYAEILSLGTKLRGK